MVTLVFVEFSSMLPDCVEFEAEFEKCFIMFIERKHVCNIHNRDDICVCDIVWIILTGI